MPLTKAQKEELVDSYRQQLSSAPHVFLLDYKGISVPQVTELRSKIREVGGQYLVAKNRLVLLSLEGEALESLRDHLQGPTALAFSQDDPVALAKVLTDFAGLAHVLEFKGGLVDGRPVAADAIQEIASLPSREELITKLVFLLKSPITRLVRRLGAIPQRFVSALEQVRQKKEQAGQ